MLNTILNIGLIILILALVVFWVILIANDKPTRDTCEDLDENFDCEHCPFPCKKHKNNNTAISK